MKILTNYHSGNIGGITQVLSSFVEFIQANDDHNLQVVGIEFSQKIETKRSNFEQFTLIQKKIDFPIIAEVLKKSKNIEQVRKTYQILIDAYEFVLRTEKPDAVLINGTFFVPWCLLNAAKKLRIPVVVHYHGSISKETENWDAASRKIFLTMEKEFDHPSFHYIFPSNFAKTVVENEIFKHRIKHASVLANAVPLHFFDTQPAKNRKTIGIVGRKSYAKNPEFIIRLARYNARQKDGFEINIITDAKDNDKFNKKLEGLVRFVKPIKNQKLPKFYSQMGVVISPSFFETYGNVAKEAVASGVPALVNNQMGVAETFQQLGLHDWVVDFKSVKNVYEKIKKVAGTSVDEKVRKSLKKSYSPHTIHKQLIKIIKSI